MNFNKYQKTKLFRLALAIVPALAIAGFFAFATSNPHIWTNGLVGYWSFDGQYTTSTDGTKDVSNNGNYGQFKNGVKPVAGISGQALSFDGVDDIVDCGNGASLNITSAITIEAWVKPKAFATYQGIVSKYQEENNGYILRLDSGVPKMYVFIPGGTWNSAGATSISTGQWYHIVGTYDKDGGANNLKLYINGQLDNSNTVTGSIVSTTYSVRIGLSYINEWSNGPIDEVRIYSRALGADEVMQHYLQTRRNLKL